MQCAKLRQVFIGGLSLEELYEASYIIEGLSLHFCFQLQESPWNLTISDGSLVFIGA